MIVVSGEPRSGTSLQMLILKKLGLEIAGEKFLLLGKEFNPSGIWEVKGIPNVGLNDHTVKEYEITEDVIKLTTHGLLNSDMKYVDKIVFCIRDPREIMVSQRKQINYKDDEFNYNWYSVHMAALVTKMELGDLADMMFVDYKTLLKHPTKQVRRVATFLEVPYTKRAAKVIRKKYRRSDSRDIEDDETARRYYNYLKALCV